MHLGAGNTMPEAPHGGLVVEVQVPLIGMDGVLIDHAVDCHARAKPARNILSSCYPKLVCDREMPGQSNLGTTLPFFHQLRAPAIADRAVSVFLGFDNVPKFRAQTSPMWRCTLRQ